ncbi:MAG TPA: metal ABC transporter permease [Candidatus Wallbacteria bacterium]|nr:metal ABC transporter permease [Candidatus Wallbacteria bacterium]
MIEILLMPFALKALFASALISVICAWSGIFVTIKNMAFFSESISHSSLAGIAIALWFGFDPSVFLVFFSVAVAAVIALVAQSSIASRDSVIGIVHATIMSAGIILLSFLRGGNTDIARYLFGDVLAVTSTDLYICSALFVLAAAYLAKFSTTHALTCLTPELAKLNGINVKKYDFMLMILLALIISVSVKIAGAILVTALLVIPSNAAKNISASYNSFVLLSVITGLTGAVAGVAASIFLDFPTGPSIVLLNSIAYFASLFARNYLKISI